MACALTVTDLFRAAVARRRHATTAEALQTPLLLRRWLSADPHYARRAAFYAAAREPAAAAAPWRRRPAESPAAARSALPLRPCPAAAAGTRLVVRHADAVARRGFKALRPRHGPCAAGSRTRSPSPTPVRRVVRQ